MASDYGLNFGFRRSDETLAIREGRFKTPKTGAQLLQGSAVEIDPANPGYYKQAGAAALPQTGWRGVLVQEEDHIIATSIFSTTMNGHDSIDLGFARKDTLSAMWSGDGTKVWFRNTAAYDRGNRHKDAVTILAQPVAVGDFLGWDGAKWVVAADEAHAWMRVTHATAGYCEAVLTF